MLNSGKFKRLAIDYKNSSYNTGQAVTFTVDTQGDKGFLTIFYVDGSDVTLLYPNGFIAPKELNGRYKFPNDLANGKFALEAYKGCKGCNEEKTTIYALLSSQQITDVSKIKSKDLMSFPKNSKESKIMSRAVRVKATSQSVTNFKPKLGKYEFVVK
jgi:hypothetical protein